MTCAAASKRGNSDSLPCCSFSPRRNGSRGHALCHRPEMNLVLSFLRSAFPQPHNAALTAFFAAPRSRLVPWAQNEMVVASKRSTFPWPVHSAAWHRL